MSIRKHGVGEVLAEPDDNVKVAKANFSDKDRAELAEENAAADRDDDEG